MHAEKESLMALEHQWEILWQVWQKLTYTALKQDTTFQLMLSIRTRQPAYQHC